MFVGQCRVSLNVYFSLLGDTVIPFSCRELDEKIDTNFVLVRYI